VGRVVIGVDPHKRSATIEVMDRRERVLAVGRFGTDTAGYEELLAAGRAWPERVWAVEGCNGVGRYLAQRLVADGEPVLDVPAKLSARARVFSTGQGRKTDATDAHSIAVVALRTPTLRVVEVDDATVALRLLVDRRDELGGARTLTANRLHRLLADLVPGGAKKDLRARQARDLLAKVRPRDVVGKTRRQLAIELVGELEAIDKKIKVARKQLAELVAATGSGLLELNGIGPPAPPGCWATSATSPGSPAAGTSPRGTALRRSTPQAVTSSGTGSPGQATGGSTEFCTSWRSSNSATTPTDAPTTAERSPPARPRWKPCAVSNDDSPTPSTGRCSPTPPLRTSRRRQPTTLLRETP
jgi:transposase